MRIDFIISKLGRNETVYFMRTFQFNPILGSFIEYVELIVIIVTKKLIPYL